MTRLHCKVDFEMHLVVPLDKVQMVVDWLDRQGDLMSEWEEAEVEVTGDDINFGKVEWIGPANENAYCQALVDRLYPQASKRKRGKARLTRQ